jgi:hypothetical protein
MYKELLNQLYNKNITPENALEKIKEKIKLDTFISIKEVFKKTYEKN